MSGAYYCHLCAAPARPGSVQPAVGEGYATGVCSGEHQYQAPDPRQKLRGVVGGEEIPNTRQRRVGMFWSDTPPSGPPARPRREPREAPSLPLFGVTRDG